MAKLESQNSLVELSVKWKRTMGLMIIIALCCFAVFSGPRFVKPKYRSTAVLYPFNLTVFSNETPTEQMLQVLNSDDIKDSLVNKFNLAQHYDINPHIKDFRYRMFCELNANVKVKKSEYESVAISVYDIDPQVACNMAYEMIDLFNQKMRNLHREKITEGLVAWKKQYQIKLREIDSLETLLNADQLTQKTREERSAPSARYLAKTMNISSGYKTKTLLNNNGKDGHYLTNTMERLFIEYDLLAKAQEKYEQALTDLQMEVTYAHVVSHPYPADHKALPVRWLIVLAGIAGTLFLSFLVIFAIERIYPLAKGW